MIVQTFTVGAFHKTIDKPIETNINVGGGGTIFQSFLNAPEATVYGAEVEFKKYFDDVFAADWWGANRMYLATNYTWSQSEVNADEGDTVQPFGYPAPVDARLFVRDGSDMQGQSEHIANLQFGVENESTGLQATLIANHVSERVSARGRPGQPDYMQEPGTTLSRPRPMICFQNHPVFWVKWNIALNQLNRPPANSGMPTAQRKGLVRDHAETINNQPTVGNAQIM